MSKKQLQNSSKNDIKWQFKWQLLGVNYEPYMHKCIKSRACYCFVCFFIVRYTSKGNFMGRAFYDSLSIYYLLYEDVCLCLYIL
jgi:hypothetical protein